MFDDVCSVSDDVSSSSGVGGDVAMVLLSVLFGVVGLLFFFFVAFGVVFFTGVVHAVGDTEDTSLSPLVTTVVVDKLRTTPYAVGKYIGELVLEEDGVLFLLVVLGGMAEDKRTCSTPTFFNLDDAGYKQLLPSTGISTFWELDVRICCDSKSILIMLLLLFSNIAFMMLIDREFRSLLQIATLSLVIYE